MTRVTHRGVKPVFGHPRSVFGTSLEMGNKNLQLNIDLELVKNRARSTTFSMARQSTPRVTAGWSRSVKVRKDWPRDGIQDNVGVQVFLVSETVWAADF